MTDNEPTITLVHEPTVRVLAEMKLVPDALDGMVDWLCAYAPECLDPDEDGEPAAARIFPHDGRDHDVRAPGAEMRVVTDNELLTELAGRKCYNSFGRKAGRRGNAEYLANLHGSPGKIPHASVFYHAKMTFFFAGISRRVSHELIRHYVGADRSEEGSPSQESTRYTHHPGHFAVHPRISGDADALREFAALMHIAYVGYIGFIRGEVASWKESHAGREPKGMDRKRIYEAAAMTLPGAACTSFIWTTNPIALAKLFAERCDYAADLEIQRFATKLRDICYGRWPNLFRAVNYAVEREAAE